MRIPMKETYHHPSLISKPKLMLIRKLTLISIVVVTILFPCDSISLSHERQPTSPSWKQQFSHVFINFMLTPKTSKGPIKTQLGSTTIFHDSNTIPSSSRYLMGSSSSTSSSQSEIIDNIDGSTHDENYQAINSNSNSFSNHNIRNSNHHHHQQQQHSIQSDPIDPQNKICRDYLKKFLQGATDTNDECHGLQNAYSNAGCSPSPLISSNIITNQDLISNSFQQSNDRNHTDGDDDNKENDDGVPQIDDFFQNFECCNVIQQYYTSRCLSSNEIFSTDDGSLSLLGCVTVLVICYFVKSMIASSSNDSSIIKKWLPETGGCILVGAVVGALLNSSLNSLHHSFGGYQGFDGELFMFILLPPIVFHAALCIDKERFRQLLLPVTMFAILGTIISAVVTGWIVYKVTNMFDFMESLPMLESFIFGALISSIDPVATLSILSGMGVSETNSLYVIIFGESLLNDGVCIALFESLVLHLDNTYNNDVTTDVDGRGLVYGCLVYFCRVSFVSIFIGLVCGIMCTIYFWIMQKRQTPVIEVCTFFSFALIAYYVANILDCSGIIAIMTTGFWLDIYVRGKPISEHDFQMELNMQSNDFLHYQHLVSSNTTYTTSSSSTTNTTPSLPPFQLRLPTYGDLRVMFSGVGHISHHAKVHVGFVSEVLSNIMETAIFAYLGLFIFNNNKWDDIPLISTGILSCTLSRIIMVVLVSLVVNSVIALKYYTFSWFRRGSRTHETNSFHDKENMYIDRNMQQILIFSGIRGAVSLALVENIPLFDAVTKGGTKLKPELKAMTSSSIIFTVFVFGAYSYRILKIRQERFTRPRDSGHLQHDYLTESLLNSENNIE